MSQAEYSRAELVSALQLLGKLLPDPTKLWIVGGAAFVLGYNAPRKTGDLDCILRKGKRSKLIDLAKNVAIKKHLDEEWLNFEFEQFNDIDTINPADFQKTLTFGNLTLGIASLELLLALKCADARDDGFRNRDYQDLEFCITNLRLTSLDEVYDITDTKDLLNTLTDDESFQLEKFLKEVFKKAA